MYRTLAVDDLPALFRMEHDYIRTVEPTFEDRWLHTIPANLRGWIDALPTSGAITDDAGGLAGAALWSHDGTVSTLTALHVDPTHRRQGIATRLLHAFLAAATANGSDRAALRVHEQNLGAESLYRAEGFDLVGTEGRYRLYERPLLR